MKQVSSIPPPLSLLSRLTNGVLSLSCAILERQDNDRTGIRGHVGICKEKQSADWISRRIG